MNEPGRTATVRGPDAGTPWPGRGRPATPLRSPARRGAGLRRTGAPRTAFVFAGGGALGAMQAGMLEALYERGVTADLLVGTSAGALNAAYVASRPQTAATARELGAVWCGLRRKDVFPLGPVTLLAGLAGRRDHLVSDRGLRRVAARHLQIGCLEEAAIPLHLIAHDPLSGQEVRLSTGPAVETVLAAAAIPGLLPPVRLGGRVLADGGVSNNTPVSHAVQLGAERIYVLPTAGPGAPALTCPPRSAPDAAVNALTGIFGARLESDLARYATAAELIVLPAANPRHVLPTNFSHARELIALSLAAARTVLVARDSAPAAARASFSGRAA
jgi:NTE family protein